MKTQIVYLNPKLKSKDVDDITYTLCSALGTLDDKEIRPWAEKIYGGKIPKDKWETAMQETWETLFMDSEHELEEQGVKIVRDSEGAITKSITDTQFRKHLELDPLRSAVIQYGMDGKKLDKDLGSLAHALHQQGYWRSSGWHRVAEYRDTCTLSA
jgi:hypothetical protein